MRLNRYSPRTEAVYVHWIKRFIRFQGVRHPQEMGAEEVKAFLSHLATQMNVAASWLKQCLNHPTHVRVREGEGATSYRTAEKLQRTATNSICALPRSQIF